MDIRKRISDQIGQLVMQNLEFVTQLESQAGEIAGLRAELEALKPKPAEPVKEPAAKKMARKG